MNGLKFDVKGERRKGGKAGRRFGVRGSGFEVRGSRFKVQGLRLSELVNIYIKKEKEQNSLKKTGQ
ncbi:MAG: hypothetical protein RBS38_02840 [Bacteroidales bacterium]|jgi:hypothetical protein|nr:hypothetical protein [Bacteroidales bacterium]